MLGFGRGIGVLGTCIMYVNLVYHLCLLFNKFFVHIVNDTYFNDLSFFCYDDKFSLIFVGDNRELDDTDNAQF